MIAVTRRQIPELRRLLREACQVFQQKCIYLSVAGTVEFVATTPHMKNYVDLNGRSFDLSALTSAELALIERFKRSARNHDSGSYRNRSLSEIDRFYRSQGLSRAEIAETVVYRVAQDIGGRQMIARGEARQPDYRDQIEELIRKKFATRREFCEAAGISEDMLSHVLARRKHLSIDRLVSVLDRVGYSLRIAPTTNKG